MYLYQNEDFKELVKLTANELGLNPQIVEKDYWVCFILRMLISSEFKNEIIFKGGTSLSKIWFEDFGRFSEDIDLLLKSDNNKRRFLNNRLSELINFINNIDSVSFDFETSTDLNAENKPIGGKFYFNYGNSKKDNIEGLKNQILLEPGYRGGIFPTTYKKMNSFVAESLIKKYGVSTSELANFEDITPFEIEALNPERILFEKIDAILAGYRKGTLKSSTRHFYDISKLIELDCVKNLKPSEINAILDDINRISKEFYGGKNLLVIETIKTSPVFQEDFDGLDELKAQYLREKHLYFGEMEDFDKMHKNICEFIKGL